MQKYGRLTILRTWAIEGSPQYHKAAECRCDCGRVVVTRLDRVRGGRAWSCGCTRRTHNMKKTTEYKSWGSMRERCLNSNNKKYRLYGGRGITISQAWDSFEQFYTDMGPKPSPKHSLDRIDGEKGYSKENCRWATILEQNNNRRDNVRFEYFGETKTAAEWARIYQVPAALLTSRIVQGWSPEAALFTPKLRGSQTLRSYTQ